MKLNLQLFLPLLSCVPLLGATHAVGVGEASPLGDIHPQPHLQILGRLNF
jgi:hypothetical protein